MATAIAKKPDPEPKLQHFQMIALDRIDADPEQPRKTFDQAKLGELAESVRVHGVVVPITVRPNPKKGDGWYLLITGERRWRASRLAGKTEIPAVVDETKYTASELLERQLLENSEREDVPPLEEADTYSKLLKLPGYTMDLLIAKTGKSKAHLYGRLKLLELAPAVRKAVVAGKLPPAHAELIARIGDAKLQEQCMRIVLGEKLNELKLGDNEYAEDVLETIGVSHERLSADGNAMWIGDAQPLSFRATKALIRQRFTTKLALAKFNPADATLTAAGACTSCPHRSGNQPELPGVVDAKGDDLCLRPACFEEKHRASFKAAAAAAKDRGVKVLDKADKVFGYDGIGIAHDSPYVDLETPLPYDLQKTPGKGGTFGKLLGKAAAEIPKVLVQDESGAPRELLDRKAAIAKLTELGKVDKPTKATSSSSGDADYKAERKKAKAKEELQEAAMSRALGDAAERIASDGDGKKLAAIVRWLARAVIYDYGQSGGDGGQAMLDRRGVEDYYKLGDLAGKAKTAGEALALVFELELSILSEAKLRFSYDKERVGLFDDGLKIAGVDWTKALVAAKEAAKAEQKADAAKAAKKAPAKKGGKKS